MQRRCSMILARGVAGGAALAVLLAAAGSHAGAQEAQGGQKSKPGDRGLIVLERMEAFAFGGTVLTGEADSTLHCDHGYAEAFIPPNARELPLVMWHSSSTKTWQTTFDGREGFQPIFLRRGWPVYLIDLPRQGRATWACEEFTFTPEIGRDQRSFTSFRFGEWTPPDPPQFFPGVQLPTDDPEFLDQASRGRYLEFSGEEFEELESDAVVELLERIGPAVLVTHSGSGIRGWLTGIKSPNVRGIVSYEPGTYVFPEGEAPPPVVIGDEEFTGRPVPLADFQKLTRMPIQVVFGDNIPEGGTGGNPLQNRWWARLVQGRQFVEAVNRHGGDAQLLHLPDIGIFGNTHFPMSDLNNVQTANLLSHYLHRKGLDRRGGAAANQVAGTR